MTPDLKPEEKRKDSPVGLNNRQKEAVLAPEKPLLIVAGAGTGKTKTLTSRILELISNGVAPNKICALTFTNKAAREMRERVLVGLAKDSFGNKEPFLGTFHSLGAKILREEARYAGRTKRFVIFDEHDVNQLVKKIVRSLPASKEGSPAFFVKRISAIKNGSLNLSSLAASSNPNDKQTKIVFQKYEELLCEANAFDFDDLLVKTVEILETEPSILKRYREKYSHIFVDEYQDINNVQYRLIRLLAEHSGKLSVVGDDQQTIYSWRGSNFEIFLDFEKDWPDAKVVILDQNYRSSGNIISAATQVIANNTRQKPKKLWTEGDPGELISLIETGGEDDEAFWVAEQIKKIPPAERNGVAILYRTNAQSRAIEQELISHHIPYRVYGGIKFYERKEIKDVLAGLRLTLNPHDKISAERLEKGLGKIKTRALLQVLPTDPQTTPSSAIEQFISATGYLDQLDRNYTNSIERQENLAELSYFADRFSDIAEFLEQVALLQSADSIRGEKSRTKNEVQLMTIHLAKGLEFERVFIIGCVEGLLPHAFSLDTNEQAEEERRLMYVAMTRAKHELFISFYDIPSRFISEIPSNLIKYESLVSDDIQFSDDEERYISFD